MTLPDDIPTFGGDPLPADPIPFRLRYDDADGEQTTEFTARGRAPYAWVMDFWAAERLNVPGQASALLTFLRRCVIDDDRDRFFALIEDPDVSVTKDTLQQLATFLLLRYEGVGPTTARSGGPKRSRSGRSNTGSGSKASRPAKAATRSKSSTRSAGRQ